MNFKKIADKSFKFEEIFHSQDFINKMLLFGNIFVMFFENDTFTGDRLRRFSLQHLTLP